MKETVKPFYDVKQLPAVNGAIVVMDPYTGRVLALSGGFSFKKSEFRFNGDNTYVCYGFY